MKQYRTILMALLGISVIYSVDLLEFVKISPLFAAWPDDPTVNVAICTLTNHQYSPTIVSDGSGGAIIAWIDHRNSTITFKDIYAQRVDSSGSVLWTTDGVPICQATENQEFPVITSDGTGGAFIAWLDQRDMMRNRNVGIYAQRVDEYGNPLWVHDGIPIVLEYITPGSQESASVSRPAIASDGAGGFIATCSVGKVIGGTHTDYWIAAVQVNSDGSLGWSVIVSETSYFVEPVISNSGLGIAVIAWNEQICKIYAARVGRGSPGPIIPIPRPIVTPRIDICTEPSQKMNTAVVGDGFGGGIITWDDLRNGNDFNIYAQRINVDGDTLWRANGVEICTAPYGQHLPDITTDNARGAIITWYDYRSNHTNQIYAQRIDPNGNPLWTFNGAAVCTTDYNTHTPHIISDGSGGAIIAWILDISSYKHIHAQKVDSNGRVLWSGDVGVAISPVVLMFGDHVLISDGCGGAIITWGDNRNLNPDIFAQRVFANGSLGHEPCIAELIDLQVLAPFRLTQNNPNPFNTQTSIRYEIPEDSRVTLTVYNISGQRVRTLVDEIKKAGYYTVQWDSQDKNGKEVTSGIYFYAIKVGNFIDTKKMVLIR